MFCSCPTPSSTQAPVPRSLDCDASRHGPRFGAIAQRSFPKRPSPKRPRPKRPRLKLRDALLSCGLSVTAALAAVPALGAEVMNIAYGPFEVSVPLEDLEHYARTGQLSGELSRYGGLFSPEQQADLRQALNQRVEMNPTLVSQIAYSKTGDIVLKRLGSFIKSNDSDNGLVALRATVVQAAASTEGLTLLNLIRKFPTREVDVDLQSGMQIATEVTALLAQGDRMVATIEAQAQQEASQTSVQTPYDLRRPGAFRWEKTSLALRDESGSGSFARDRAVPLDIYMPQGLQGDPAPVALISHGIGSNRKTMAYLAKHLASHGIAVVIPEHVGSNSNKFKKFLDGIDGPPEPREAIDRPLDATFVLDHLEQLERTDSRFQGQIDLTRVTAIGQSFGGYTALALGGAELNFQSLNRSCVNGEPKSLLNFSLLLQCRVAELGSAPKLADPRIKGILAINPLTSKLFNRSGLEKVAVPTMIVSSSADFIVPPSEEQLQPFTWLKTPERYLVVMRNATHFSSLEPPAPGDEGLPLPAGLEGPDLSLTKGYTAALSLAFVKRHGAGEKAFAPYLSASYAQQLSGAAVPLSLVRTISSDELSQAARSVQKQL